MVRALVSFRLAGGGSEGWEVDFSQNASSPRIGEEILLLDDAGEQLRRGRVADVRHLVTSDGPRAHRSRCMDVEIDVQEQAA